jgi:hypothetical protein
MPTGRNVSSSLCCYVLFKSSSDSYYATAKQKIKGKENKLLTAGIKKNCGGAKGVSETFTAPWRRGA